MRIDDFFAERQRLLASRASVRQTRLTFDKRTDSTGYIRGEVHYIDDKVLHLREFVALGNEPQRLLYVYLLLDQPGQMIFRYDNSGHHRDLPTFPHHKHSGPSGTVSACNEPDFTAVLDEADQHITLPSVEP